MNELVAVFLAGVAGSMHCLGMCGGFACALGGGAAGVARHLLYNLGRILTYCFIGAVIGQLGAVLVHHGDGASLGYAQRVLALVSGGLMLIVGLQFLGVLGGLRLPLLSAGAQHLAQAFSTLRRAPGVGAPLALGVANGLLPCPLVYAFAAQAAACGGALPGLATMAAFGLGTLPMMLFAGGVGARVVAQPAAAGRVVRLTPQGARTVAIGVGWRRFGVRIAGAFIIALGVLTCARGLFALGPHGLGG